MRITLLFSLILALVIFALPMVEAFAAHLEPN